VFNNLIRFIKKRYFGLVFKDIYDDFEEQKFIVRFYVKLVRMLSSV